MQEDISFDNLVAIVARLRKECPWDREQTFDSIKGHTIEEAYEVVEAIDEKNYDELCHELGDLLLHVLFHSRIAEDEGLFNHEDVIASITDKLIRRHPHVFGDTEVDGAVMVKVNWEKLKREEGRTSAVDGVPRNLPALLRATRLQDKASKIEFDWPHRDEVWQKVEEEIRELKSAVKDTEQDRIEEELGDLLFALVNYARFVDVDPEAALRRTNEKFIRRFQYMEKKFVEEGKDIHRASLEDMDVYWEEAKTAARS